MLYTNNPLEREDKLFYPTRIEVIRGTYLAWLRVVGERPTEGQLALKVAHWAFETGWFKAGLHWWNFNNAKTSPNRPHTYFRCGETENEKTVWYDPPNIQTCFQVCDTIEDGLARALAFIALDTTPNNGRPNRYEKAWIANLAEDCEAFCTELARANFYTADPGHYHRSVDSCMRVLLQSDDLARVMVEMEGVEYAEDTPPVEPPEEQVHSPATNDDIAIVWADMQVPWGAINEGKLDHNRELNERWK